MAARDGWAVSSRRRGACQPPSHCRQLLLHFHSPSGPCTAAGVATSGGTSSAGDAPEAAGGAAAGGGVLAAMAAGCALVLCLLGGINLRLLGGGVGGGGQVMNNATRRGTPTQSWQGAHVGATVPPASFPPGASTHQRRAPQACSAPSSHQLNVLHPFIGLERQAQRMAASAQQPGRHLQAPDTAEALEYVNTRMTAASQHCRDALDKFDQRIATSEQDLQRMLLAASSKSAAKPP